MPENTEYIVKSNQASFEMPDLSVGQYVSECMNRIITKDRNRIALIDPHIERKLTFSQLNEDARKIGQALLRLNIDLTTADQFMFFSDNSLDYITILLGVTYLGLAVVPIAPSYGSYELTQQISETGSQVLCLSKAKLPILKKVMASAECATIIRNLKLLLIMDRDVDENVLHQLKSEPSAPKVIITFSELVNHPGQDVTYLNIPSFPLTPSSTSVIMYTSGTTGKAKGIVHSNRSFLAQITAGRPWDLLMSAIYNMNYPLGHMSGLIALWNNLTMGITAVVFNKPVDTDTILAAIDRYRISIVMLSATLSVDLFKNDYSHKYDLSSIKVMGYGGSKAPEHIARGLIAKYKVRLFGVYGTTEFMNPLRQVSAVFENGNLGAPVANCEMKIIDLESGKSLPAGEQGEICLRGPNCFVGYVGDKLATDKVIDREGWYHTGDIGYYDEKCCLFLVDRVSELIKYKYFSVAAAEVEAFLMTHPAIKEVCVTGVKHATEGYHARAYVELMKGKQATEQEIVQFAQDNIGYHNWLNGGVRLVGEMPHVSMGKIDRQYFKRLVQHELLTQKAPEYK